MYSKLRIISMFIMVFLLSSCISRENKFTSFLVEDGYKCYDNLCTKQYSNYENILEDEYSRYSNSIRIITFNVKAKVFESIVNFEATQNSNDIGYNTTYEKYIVYDIESNKVSVVYEAEVDFTYKTEEYRYAEITYFTDTLKWTCDELDGERDACDRAYSAATSFVSLVDELFISSGVEKEDLE